MYHWFEPSWHCRAEARKEQLAKAAEEMRESGKTASAFSESPYAVSEDKSPNVHTRQVYIHLKRTSRHISVDRKDMVLVCVSLCWCKLDAKHRRPHQKHVSYSHLTKSWFHLQEEGVRESAN